MAAGLAASLTRIRQGPGSRKLGMTYPNVRSLPVGQKRNAETLKASHLPDLPDIIVPYTETPWEMEIQMFILDWIDENLDDYAPLAGFIGIGIAIALCFIFGA
jgi:hypothetical protein